LLLHYYHQESAADIAKKLASATLISVLAQFNDDWNVISPKALTANGWTWRARPDPASGRGYSLLGRRSG
jgi:hypothetical protein